MDHLTSSEKPISNPVDISTKILIIGGSGFIGNELGITMVRAGYQVNLLTRDIQSAARIAYPAKIFLWQKDGAIPGEALESVTTIINLAGESIASGRWTEDKKQRIVRSRVESVKQVAAAARVYPIKTFIQASAIGFYGDTGQSAKNEKSDSGDGFLAEAVVEWEKPLEDLPATIRCITMRLGVVLGDTGGALKEILSPYFFGFGAIIGPGNQYFSWIHIQDLIRFIEFALSNKKIKGVYNVTSPQPTTYRLLHEQLTSYFSSLKWLKAPSFFFKILLGKKSELLLASQKILPERSQEQGFSFNFETIESCFSNLLDQNYRNCVTLVFRQWTKAGRDSVWDFFSTEKNLETLTPRSLRFQVLNQSGLTIEAGSIIDYQLRLHGIPLRWRSKIVSLVEKQSFEDDQLKGPYKTWHHTHRFSDLGSGCLIEDIVKFKVPFGLLGALISLAMVKKEVEKIFQYRRQRIDQIFNSD